MARKRRQRRPKGEGYITYDDKRKRWRATVQLPDGRSKTKYCTDERAAEAWRAAQVYAIEHPEPEPDPCPTILDALAEMLTDSTYLGESTQANYRIYAGHINTAFGMKIARDVSGLDVQRMDRIHRLKLSGATADAILTLLSTLYERLIALEVVAKNPVRTYRKIAPARARKGTPLREPIFLTVSETRALIKALEGDPYLVPILWMLIMGLRIGEIRGLRWVSVSADTVAVIEQRRHRDRFTPAALKTEDKIGKGRILPSIHQLMAITPRGKSGLVFPNPNGGSIDENTLRYHLDKAVVRAGIRRPRIHDLRHTAGSNILQVGCPLEYVAYFLGHTPGRKNDLIQFTQSSHYARPNADALRPYVEAWAAVLLGAPELTMELTPRVNYTEA
jgi:integrase